jgi:phage shock protein PspC (stress-responsive transcriptional regulator)
MVSQRRLMLDRSNKKVAGVCAGFARYFDADIILIRVIWLTIALATGIGFIAYLAAWMVMPSDHGVPAYAGLAPYPQAG